MTSQDQQAEELGGRLFNAAIETLDLLSVHLGDRLGLYRSLAQDGPATPDQLAKRASIHPRYAREWLEQQAATGILTVDDASAGENERTYSLPAGHAEALTDPDSPFSIAPVARAVVSCARTLPKVLEAFRSGGGVDWAAYGADGIEAQGDFNRPWLVHQFGKEFLPSVPDVHARLQADPPAHVADIACGVGWSSVAIARAYPKARVDGLDSDEMSVGLAQTYAKENGIADRVTFAVHDAAAQPLTGTYDLAVMIEALHDVARPVEVLANIRRSLSPRGCLIVADERVGETFRAPADEVERLLYGFSITMCLPAGMTEQPSAATGTVMRPATLRTYAADAGFSGVSVLEQIEHPLLRFYRLDP
jgi:2-polyprenyl-3-methyl-5-hydroxy-6-metoxy-1,4-benzoquinol methylase